MTKIEKAAYAKIWRSRHVEKVKENQLKMAGHRKQWRLDNPDKCLKYAKKWRDNNPEKIKTRRMSNFHRFNQLKYSAKVRKLEITITLEQWLAIVSPNSCSYCGGGLPATGSGLDRIDNSKGYVENNITACCTRCNSIFLHAGKEETYEHMQRMLDFRKQGS